MYRWFLSWRYLTTRALNVVGIIGVGIAVGVMIAIVSIMSGFLEEHKKLLRAGLSDVVVKPDLYSQDLSRAPVPTLPHRLLDELRADPDVVAATPRLSWYGLVAGARGRAARQTGAAMASSDFKGLTGVELVGVDVFGDGPLALHGLRVQLAIMGIPWTPGVIQDEYDATSLARDFGREANVLTGTRLPVKDPDQPFATPGLRDQGLPLDTIVIGEQLARSLGLLEVGAVLKLATFVVDPSSGEVFESSRDFLVGGTFRSTDNQTDLGRVYMDRRALWDFLGRRATYNEVLVKLEDYETQGRAFQQRMTDQLAREGLIFDYNEPWRTSGQVRTWEDFRQTMLRAIENERILLGIVVSLVLVVATFTIFAILTAMVAEKRRDIGILSAVGAPPTGILSTFLVVGFWTALLGVTAGTLLGVGFALRINEFEIWLSDQFNTVIFDRNVYAFDSIPVVLELGPILAISMGAVVLTVLFAAIPAYRAARMHPVDSLRYE
ncbi:MAG: ABC transporter permease [Planctomycetota bacterium]